MATTKARLAEQILRVAKGGYISDDVDIDSREVILFIEQERDAFVRKTIFENKSIGEHEINGDLLSTYKEEIKNDAVRNESYVDVPYTPVSLPNDAGFQSLVLLSDQSISFVRRTATASSLYRGMKADNLLGRAGFYVEGSRAFLKNLPNGVTTGTNLLLKLVVSSKDIGDDEPFPIPAEQEQAVIKNVLQLLKVMDAVEQDNANDSKDN